MGFPLGGGVTSLHRASQRGSIANSGQWACANGHAGSLVILPKLFRRLAEYLTLDGTGKVSLARFPAFLAAHDGRLFHRRRTGHHLRHPRQPPRTDPDPHRPTEQIVFLEG
jgi:hypothetical protein